MSATIELNGHTVATLRHGHTRRYAPCAFHVLSTKTKTRRLSKR